MALSAAKAQVVRVESALAWLQKRLGTSLYFHVTASADVKDVMQVSRSGRGADDIHAFHIEISVAAVAGRSIRQLRSDVLHETLHAVTMRMVESALENGVRSKKGQAALYEAWENAVYALERILAPALNVDPS